MPAIRDYAYNYTATATDLHVTCPCPSYAQNDLMIAQVSADTGTQSWAGLENVGAYWQYTATGAVFTDETAAIAPPFLNVN
mgnify:CR=1 FL=1